MAERIAPSRPTDDPWVRTLKTRDQILAAEDDWRAWLTNVFPGYVGRGFAPYHAEFWEWVWAVRAGERARPFVGIWPRGAGKALAVDTPIPTPTGWAQMGNLRVGDTVFDHHGNPTPVIWTSGVEVRSAYRVCFVDGSSLVASDDHQWVILDRNARNNLPDLRSVDWATDSWPIRSRGVCAVDSCGAVVRKGALCSAHSERRRRGLSLTDPLVQPRSSRGHARYGGTRLTTADLARLPVLMERAAWDEHVYAIPVAGAIQTIGQPLPVDPYVLGAWLGDGHSAAPRVTVGAEDRVALVELLRSRHPDLRDYDRPNGVVDVSLLGLRPALAELGVLNNKHVPPMYLRASAVQRLDLLRGLLDTDGGVSTAGAEFTSTREALARGCAEIARSLGYRVTLTEGRATLYGNDCGPKWRLTITGVGPEVFALPRKAERVAAHAERAMRWTGAMHYIDAVEPALAQPVQCIQVAAPSGMFLAGEQMIPTHNSTSAELACAAIAARRTRRYGLYVSETQEQADDHVQNVAGLLESATYGIAYPEAASRKVGKHGNVRGWRRNRLRAASGFTLDAIGLDTAARGVKLDESRPDLLIFDDLDGKLDSAATTAKKITTLTHTLLPAASEAPAVLAIQNTVIADGIFARLADGRADFLADRIVSGPHPALRNLAYEQRGGRAVLVAGEPTWEAMDLRFCQAKVDEMGLTAFLAECQHETEAPAGGMFDHLAFRHCRADEVPDLVRVVVWVDPAVTSTDQSDAHGIQADGLAPNGDVYRLYSWEARTSPRDALRRGIRKAVELNAEAVGVETDQGGDTWQDTYELAAQELVEAGEITPEQIPAFRQAKAGAGHGPKVHRASRMLAEYERCIAKGTLIATEHGSLPIETVRPGMRVWTRAGLRRVRAAGYTGDKPTVAVHAAGRALRCTPDHPLYTRERGFIDALRVVPNRDTLCLLCELGHGVINTPALTVASLYRDSDTAVVPVLQNTAGRRRVSRSGHSLSSMVSAITGRIAGAIGDRGALLAARRSIAWCGNLRMAHLIRAWIFIISMAILRIIDWRTFAPFLRLSTSASIHESSIALRQLNDYGPSTKRLGRRDPLSQKSASNAATHTKLARSVDPGFAHRPATRGIGIITVEPAGKAPVYNLSVEGEEEFFANDILVHNCRFIHVLGTHEALERALKRFPLTKPLDLVDAGVWSWMDLTGQLGAQPVPAVLAQAGVSVRWSR